MEPPSASVDTAPDLAQPSTSRASGTQPPSDDGEKKPKDGGDSKNKKGGK